MIEGSTSQVVTLVKSRIALERAMGASAAELGMKYNLSTAVMTQALEDMGFIKHRGTEVGDVVKDKFELAADAHELTVEEVKAIIVECGYKLPVRGAKRYTIVNDIKIEELPAEEATTI
jgi:hypothetical protein